MKNNKKRPLLQGENPRGRVHELMEVRHPIYMEAARAFVRAEYRSPEEIAEDIMREVGNGK